jgi:hypothetical protein
MFHPHLDSEEINATVLVTDGPMRKPQMPHMNCSWESILLPTGHDSWRNRSKLLRGCAQLPFTGITPVSTNCAFIYLWTSPGAAVSFHIEHGKLLMFIVVVYLHVLMLLGCVTMSTVISVLDCISLHCILPPISYKLVHSFPSCVVC